MSYISCVFCSRFAVKGLVISARREEFMISFHFCIISFVKLSTSFSYGLSHLPGRGSSCPSLWDDLIFCFFLVSCFAFWNGMALLFV